MPYALHEPFPTYQSTIGFGRGGAGNRTHKVPNPDLQAPSSTLPKTTYHQPCQPAFSTGRGGAGNMHTSNEDRAIFHFDEELEREKRRSLHAAPVYHVGRGGTGNLVHSNERRESQGSDSSRSTEGKRSSREWIKGLARKA